MRQAQIRASILALIIGCSVSTQSLAQPTHQAISEDADKASALPLTSMKAQAADGDIVVTGSRLASQGFSAPTPVTVIGEERNKALAITNIGQALADIPSFRPTNTPQSGNASSGTMTPVNAGARIADLRGLGPSRTLVLVNGRRFVSSTSTGSVDLGVVPVLLLDRVEVVTGGASAAYGSDAVSGVVNFILKDRFSGVAAVAEYGQTDHNDNRQFLFSGVAGTEFGGGRGHVVVGIEYEKANGSKDCYSRSWCSQEWENATNSGFLTNGFPANNFSRDIHTASATPGGLVTRSIYAAGVTAPPPAADPLRGIQFSDNGAPTRFNFGSIPGGLFMIGGSGEGLNYYLSAPLLSIPTKRYNGYMLASYDLGGVEAFLEASYGFGAGYPRGPETRDNGFPSTGGLTINVANPFIPQSVRATMLANNIVGLNLGRLSSDLGFTGGSTTREVYRTVAGLKGTIGGNWKWDSYYEYGQTDYRQIVTNNRITANFRKAIDVVAVNGAPVCAVNANASTADDDPACVPLNLFGRFQFDPRAKAYSYGTAWQNQRFTQHNAAANLSGSLFNLPAGPFAVASGVEYRRDSLRAVADPISAVNGFSYFNVAPSAGRVSVYEGYLELGAPVLADLPLIYRLGLNGAVRHAHYEVNGVTSAKFNATTWKVGATYEPIPQLLLRATRSRDVRAPNATELFAPVTAGQNAVTDRGSQVFVRTLSGGNINLMPELADTFTMGATLQPSGAFDGLRLSVDYYDIKVRQAIATTLAGTVVDRCNTSGAQEFCDLITRNSAGVPTQVSLVFQNLNRQRQRGIDIEARYRLPLDRVSQHMAGKLDLGLLATHAFEQSIIDSTGVKIDRAGENSNVNGLLSWVVDGTISYSQGPVTFTIQERYLSPGKINVLYIAPDDAGYSTTLPNSSNLNHVDARLYTNLVMQYDFRLASQREAQLSLKISNLTNVSPPFPIRSGVYYDVLGRAYRASLRIKF